MQNGKTKNGKDNLKWITDQKHHIGESKSGDENKHKSQINDGSRWLKQNTDYIAKLVSPPGVVLPAWGRLTRRPIENAGAWSRTARAALLGS